MSTGTHPRRPPTPRSVRIWQHPPSDMRYCSRARSVRDFPAGARQRDVAQLGSALDWGSRGRRFKSCRPDVVSVGQRPFPIRGSGLWRRLIASCGAWPFSVPQGATRPRYALHPNRPTWPGDALASSRLPPPADAWPGRGAGSAGIRPPFVWRVHDKLDQGAAAPPALPGWRRPGRRCARAAGEGGRVRHRRQPRRDRATCRAQPALVRRARIPPFGGCRWGVRPSARCSTPG